MCMRRKRKPFLLQCQQKESRLIMNVETELNNTVNKTCIESNDFIYRGLDTISLRTVRSEERRLNLQAKVQWKHSNTWHKQRWTWNVYSHDYFQKTSDVTCLETHRNVKTMRCNVTWIILSLVCVLSYQRLVPHQAEIRLHFHFSW